MEKKQFKFELKELKETGEFEGYAAVFGNLDNGGDIIEAGAFTKTLLENEEFPITWMHQSYDILGTTKAEQDNVGLKVTGFLNMAVQSAREKHALLKQRAIKALSIGYDTIKRVFENNNTIRRIQEVKLWEVALVPWAMNSKAIITDVKMERSIHDILSEVISWKDAHRICFDDEQKGLATKAVESLNALLNPEPDKSTQKGGEPQDKQTKPDGHLVSIGEEFAKINSILGGKH